MAILVGAWTFFHTGTMLNLSNFLEIDHHKNVRFGDPDHDQVLRTKTWSCTKTTWSS